MHDCQTLLFFILPAWIFRRRHHSCSNKQWRHISECKHVVSNQETIMHECVYKTRRSPERIKYSPVTLSTHSNQTHQLNSSVISSTRLRRAVLRHHYRMIHFPSDSLGYWQRPSWLPAFIHPPPSSLGPRHMLWLFLCTFSVSGSSPVLQFPEISFICGCILLPFLPKD